MGPVRQIQAGVLDVGYVDAGPRRRSCGPAAARLAVRHPHLRRGLAAAGGGGLPGIVPYLRGYGTTRFLSDETFRNGQQSVLALDAVALMDALGIERAVVAGADWGARTAGVVAALWPERCAGLSR